MELLNKKNSIIIASVLLIAGVGTYFYQQSCDQKEQAAKSAFYQIQKTMETELTTLNETEKAAGSVLDVDAKFPKTVAALNELINDKKASGQVLFEASFKLGRMYLDHSKDDSLDKAIATMKKANEFAKTDFQKASSLYVLGGAQERANQVKDAADSYQKALKHDKEGLKEEILLSLVRVSMKSNNSAQAKSYSDQLSKEAPGTRAAQEAQKLISKT